MKEQPLPIPNHPKIHARVWLPVQMSPRGVVILIHGLGDHGGRFRDFAQRMTRRGWSVAAADLPGHGRTQGRRGMARSYGAVLELIASLREQVALRLPGTPQFVLGHSMGGNFAANYLLRREEFDPTWIQAPSGLLLVAPMIMPPEFLDRQKIFAAWGTGYLLRWLRITIPARADQLTSGEAQAEEIATDPLMHQHISLYLATQLLAQGRFALDHARDLNCRTLVIHGDEDELIDRDACHNFAIRIGTNASSVRWPGGRHDLLNDVDAEAVVQHLSGWLGETAEEPSSFSSPTSQSSDIRIAA